MDPTWKTALWTDWFTAWADWSSIISPFKNIVPPPQRVADLGRVTALQAKFEVTDVVGGATLFLVTSASRSGPWSPIAEVNTTAIPDTNVYTVRVGGGALTISNPTAPSVQANAFGRYLGWTVKAPTGTVAFWGITFKASLIYQGDLSFGDDLGAGAESVEVQPLIAIAGDNTIQPGVTQSAPAWTDTSRWTEFLLEVDVLLVTNAKVYLQTSISGGASDDWVDVVSGGITAEGRTTYLLNRDTTTSSANLLRNFFRWQVRIDNPAVTAWEAGLRITGNGR